MKIESPFKVQVRDNEDTYWTRGSVVSASILPTKEEGLVYLTTFFSKHVIPINPASSYYCLCVDADLVEKLWYGGIKTFFFLNKNTHVLYKAQSEWIITDCRKARMANRTQYQIPMGKYCKMPQMENVHVSEEMYAPTEIKLDELPDPPELPEKDGFGATPYKDPFKAEEQSLVQKVLIAKEKCDAATKRVKWEMTDACRGLADYINRAAKLRREYDVALEKGRQPTKKKSDDLIRALEGVVSHIEWLGKEGKVNLKP